MHEFNYAVMEIDESGLILVGNQITGDVLIRVMCSPYATYMDNRFLGIELCRVVDGYIAQHLGGPRMKLRGIVTLTEVTISAAEQWRRLIVNRRTWQTIGEIYLYPTPNTIQSFMYECEIARTVESYIKSVRSRMRENGWGTS